MSAGGPGDHPLTDIINHEMDVYGREADDLLRNSSHLCRAANQGNGGKNRLGM